MPRTYAGVSLRDHVARILGRRQESVPRALSDAGLADELARDVVAALVAEHSDHDAIYHAFEPQPFPSIAEVAIEIRDFARTVATDHR